MSQEVSKKLVSSGHLLISSDIQVRFLVLSWMMSLVFAGFDLVIPDSWIYERPRCLEKTQKYSPKRCFTSGGFNPFE